MAKYRAKVDVPPLKAGDIMEASEPLVPEYADKFERVGSKTETVSEKQPLVNPNREELKARATELGVAFANNIPTERLIELVEEAEAKAKSESEPDEGEGDGDGEGEGEDGEGADETEE